MKINGLFHCTISGFYSSGVVANKEAESDMKDLIFHLSSTSTHYTETNDGSKISWSIESTRAPLSMVAEASKKYPNLRFCIHCENYDSNGCDYRFFYKAGIMSTYLRKSWTNLPVGIIDPTDGYKEVLKDE